MEYVKDPLIDRTKMSKENTKTLFNKFIKHHIYLQSGTEKYVENVFSDCMKSTSSKQKSKELFKDFIEHRINNRC